ncbi:ras association domain-containing protein 10-like [Hemiscyllium ocellatum]|uniref:ras association domain-containing protein 10-like n=1 Tax=Hemiscyllium ocellatum TaxID=170820 RepID=UPI0029669C33|nr:ras association domain-containing protein 10-like [Hemiscyllium ocellatum]
MENEEGGKLSVWLCQEEKLVSGLSRRTTCADVVAAVLEESRRSGAAALSGDPSTYCLVEKWRGFERTLPDRTRILRLWSAWGEERERVTFVLLKSQAASATGSPRSAEAKVVRSCQGGASVRGPGRLSLALLPRHKQRRVVRKAFRKLAKLNRAKRRAGCPPGAGADTMETLVHLVLSQDHTLRQQLHRIRELDREIERYESSIHQDRVRRHGANYVQDTYLLEPPERGLELTPTPGSSSSSLPELPLLQRELSRRQQQLQRLRLELEQELELRGGQGEGAGGEEPPPPPPPPPLLLLEQERLRTQLSASLCTGLRLDTELELSTQQLAASQRLYQQKHSELQGLLEQLHSLRLDGEQEHGRTCAQVTEPQDTPTLDSSSAWLDPGGVSSSCQVPDEDSDTGLSSMNSQDSDTIPVSESLV